MVVLVVLSVLTPARADEPAPWAKGVTAEDRARALALFEQGNARFLQKNYRDAASLYVDALERWKHPRIHGNLAVALIELDKPLEALDHVDAALAHGSTPFAPEIHEQLLRHRKLLSMQVAHIKVVCSEAGTLVSLDGDAMFTGPGEVIRRVRAGRHQVVGKKAGFTTFVKPVYADARSERSIEVRMVPVGESVRYERRWAAWKPWATTAGGVVLVGAGVGFAAAARKNANDYDRAFASACPDGCDPDDPDRLSDAERALRGRVRWQNATAITSLALGGALAATGVALVFLNQPRAVPASEPAITTAPMLGPDVAGWSVTMTF